MGLMGCPEKSVRNCHYSLRNTAEECSSDTFRMYTTYCFSTAKLVTRTPLSVTSHVYTLTVCLEEENDRPGWFERFQDGVWELWFGAVVWELWFRAVVWELWFGAVVWELWFRNYCFGTVV